MEEDTEKFQEMCSYLCQKNVRFNLNFSLEYNDYLETIRLENWKELSKLKQMKQIILPVIDTYEGEEYLKEIK